MFVVGAWTSAGQKTMEFSYSAVCTPLYATEKKNWGKYFSRLICMIDICGDRNLTVLFMADALLEMLYSG